MGAHGRKLLGVFPIVVSAPESALAAEKAEGAPDEVGRV
jgi:hypothetical protein